MSEVYGEANAVDDVEFFRNKFGPNMPFINITFIVSLPILIHFTCGCFLYLLLQWQYNEKGDIVVRKIVHCGGTSLEPAQYHLLHE